MTRSILLLLTLAGTLPGCFLALDFDRDDDRGQWSSDDDRDDDTATDTDDTDAPVDTDDTDVPSITLAVDPDELVIGTSTIVVFTVTSDSADDVAEAVVSIDLGPEVDVGATRVLDGDTLAVTVEVPADATEGDLDVTLDIEDVGLVVFRDALTRVAQ